MLIDGIHVPLTAPFYRDGSSYLRKLEHNVDRYSLTPVRGMVALGPGGEASSLSDAETAEFLHIVSATAAPEKVLIAGIAKDSVRGALALAEQAAAAGFDAVLLGVPHIWPELVAHGGMSQIRLFLQTVADACPLPVMLWSGSSSHALELSVELVGELAGHPNIVGLYDAGLTIKRYSELAKVSAGSRREVVVTTVFAPVTGRMLKAQSDGPATFVSAESLGLGAAVAVAAPKASLQTRKKAVGFQIMSAGNVAGLLPLLEAGAAGALPQLAACAPQGCYEVYAALKDGDAALSAEKALRLEAADEVMRSLGVAGLKYGCDWNGYYGGTPRLPRLPLTAEQRAQVEDALREVRN